MSAASEHRQASSPKNNGARRWPSVSRYAAAVGCGALAGALALELLSRGAMGSYLGLQAASDFVHRLAVVAVPVALVVLGLTWMLSELGQLRRWLRRLGRWLAVVSLATVAGVALFVLRFDLRLEQLGLTGQLSVSAAGNSVRLGEPRGPFRERSAEVPALAVESLSGGDAITLDRRSLARKRASGSFVWHHLRPGPPPAALVLVGQLLVYSGPGPQYEDDVVVAAFDVDSGRRLWRFHCLGNAISEVAAAGGQLAFSTWRPSTSSVHLLEAARPKALWTRRFAGAIRRPPRFGPDGVEVHLGSHRLVLDRRTGQTLWRLPVAGRGATAAGKAPAKS